jgi:hypothetical protein
MFEKESEEWVKNNLHNTEEDYIKAFKDGAEFGFQKGIKAKINTTTISDCPIKDEWHYVKDGDLPNHSRYVWTNVGAGYYDDGWFDDFGRLNNVIAWCEPKFEEN